MAIFARIMSVGFGTFVPQVIQNYQVVNLEKQGSLHSAISHLHEVYPDAVVLHGTAWDVAVEQAEKDLAESLVPAETADVDDILFEKLEIGLCSWVVTRTTKNLIYAVRTSCADMSPVKFQKNAGILFRSGC